MHNQKTKVGHKPAGCLALYRASMWRFWILTKRNFWGTFCGCCFPFSFCLLMMSLAVMSGNYDDAKQLKAIWSPRESDSKCHGFGLELYDDVAKCASYGYLSIMVDNRFDGNSAFYLEPTLQDYGPLALVNTPDGDCNDLKKFLKEFMLSFHPAAKEGETDPMIEAVEQLLMVFDSRSKFDSFQHAHPDDDQSVFAAIVCNQISDARNSFSFLMRHLRGHVPELGRAQQFKFNPFKDFDDEWRNPPMMWHRGWKSPRYPQGGMRRFSGDSIIPPHIGFLGLQSLVQRFFMHATGINSAPGRIDSGRFGPAKQQSLASLYPTLMMSSPADDLPRKQDMIRNDAGFLVIVCLANEFTCEEIKALQNKILPDNTWLSLENRDCLAEEIAKEMNDADAWENSVQFRGLIIENFRKCTSSMFADVRRGYNIIDYNEYRSPIPEDKGSIAIPATICGNFSTFVYTVFVWQAIRLMMQDKVSKMQELSKMFGMSDYIMWMSRYNFLFFQQILLVIMTWLTMMVLYKNIFPLYILCLMVLAWAAIMGFAVFLSSLFSNPGNAVLFAVVVFQFALLPAKRTLSDSNYPNADLLRLEMLLPPVAFYYACFIFEEFDASGGLSAGNIGATRTTYSLNDVYGMLFLDAILYFFVGWYICNVFPGETGIPLPWYFPLQKCFWCGDTVASQVGAGDRNVNNLKFAGDPNFETVSPDLVDKIQVQIDSVSKRFRTRVASNMYRMQEVRAVNNVSLDMYRGEIFALLGHNGAGKTTLVNMLTGMMDSTGGRILVNDIDLKQSPAAVRPHVSYCPQYNIIFPNMTCYEHLWYFSTLRGVPDHNKDRDILSILRMLGIGDKIVARAKTLSGGQKRRLCCGMALVGNCSLVVLDEPTSGMDPASRRSLWDALKLIKRTRTIVLITHFMEEADYLGDRIAIMTGGIVRCCGSSQFLKNRFGIGYSVVLTKLPEMTAENMKEFKKDLKSIVPTSVIDTEVGAEIRILVPTEHSIPLSNLLERLETAAKEYHIGSFVVGVSSLEEVFLKVGHSADTHLHELRNANTEENTQAEDKYNNLYDGEKNYNKWDELGFTREALDATQEIGMERPNKYDEEEKNREHQRAINAFTNASRAMNYGNSFQAAMRHTKALVIKKFHFMKRDIYTLVAICVVPPIMLTLLLIAGTPKGFRGDPISFSLEEYFTYKYKDLTRLKIPMTKEVNVVAGFLYDCAEWHGDSLEIIDSLNPIVVDDMLGNYDERTMLLGLNLASVTLEDVSKAPIKMEVDLYYNAFSRDSLPTWSNVLVNCLARKGKQNAALHMDMAPLYDVVQQPAVDFGMNLNILFALAIVPARWGSLAVNERITKVKQQQYLAGISPWVYWGVTFTLDYLLYLIPASFIYMVLVVRDVIGLTANGSLTISLLCLFGLASAPLAYCLSFLFEASSSLELTTVIGTLASPIAVQLFEVFEPKQYERWVRYVVNIVPPCALFEGLGYVPSSNPDVAFDMNSAGTAKVYLLVSVLFWFMVLGICDFISSNPRYHFCLINSIRAACCGPPFDPIPVGDDDVKAEKQKVDSGMDDGIISVRGLTKVYSRRVAVKDVSFAVQAGECFGYLGVNGAGKTTAMQMLTTDIKPTSGTASCGGFDLVRQAGCIRRILGYCPQFDALWGPLTGAEHIYFYLRIMGVPENRIKDLCIDIFVLIGAQKHMHRAVTTYSGGNKRKLSLALAFLGRSRLIFLDEPSSGVDPASRRQLWNAIIAAKNCQKVQRSIVLTTHSMEECEALCDRLTIMKAGQLCCIGTPSHVKSIYGKGYQLDITFNTPQSMEQFQTWAVESLKGTLVETVGLHQNWSLPKIAALSVLYKMMHNLSKELDFKYFSLSNTSLENVFLNFNREEGILF